MADPRDLAILREAQWRTWFPDTIEVDVLLNGFVAFCNDVVYIQHPSGKRLFDLRPAQVETARNLLAGSSLIVLKARQIGFSTLVAVYSLWRNLGIEDFVTIFLSKGEREAIKLGKKEIYAYNHLPDWVKARAPRRNIDNILKQEWDNGSSMEALPSKKDAARGDTATLLVADEFASLENPEEAWSAMEPAADVGGQIMVLSTAKGAGTLFEELWNAAYTGVSTLVPLFWSWREQTDRDDAWYEDKRRSLPTHILHQEYPSNPEEAFIKSGRMVFDADRLAEMKERAASRGYLMESKFHYMADGEVWVYDFPKEGREYCVGVDIAEGLEHGDHSVCMVLDADSHDLVAMVHCQQPIDTFAQTAIDVCAFYNVALMGPEANNVGLAFIKDVVRLGYPRIYKRKRFGKRHDAPSETLGFLTSSSTKPMIIDGLYTWLRTHEVPSLMTVRELRTFVRDERGRMSGSPHDDRVMSLALAVEMLKYVHDDAYRQEKVINKGTMAWWERELATMDEKPKRLHHRLVRSGR